jgi:hypothetical protein
LRRNATPTLSGRRGWEGAFSSKSCRSIRRSSSERSSAGPSSR